MTNKTTNQTINETCFNPTEADERAHLARVAGKIGDALQYLSQEVAARHTEMIKLKAYLHEHKGDMDHAEKITVRQAVDQIVVTGKHGEAQRKRLVKLFHSPYFGRVDARNGHTRAQPVYIGIHSFHDKLGGEPLIHDWRAPVSSLFYDFETGEAFYDTPEGRVDCRLERKRQYKVEKGQLVFMLETSLNIHDDVLQRELSRASDDKMKNIVATIQRDQNAIIRDESASALIIQGAAGSGKTSIALHRIAFLLYRFKDTIRSSDILIISPNKVFAHYISQVLPELGEEMIRETTMEALAAQLLGEEVTFQTFAEQVAALLRAGGKKGGQKYGERIQYKATPAFLDELECYVRAISNRKVRAKDLTFGKQTVPADWIAGRFQACGPMPFAQQLNEVTEAVVDYMGMRHEVAITGKQRATLRTQLKKMMGNTDLRALYENFFVWLDRPGLFHRGKDGRYEFADVFPLIYLKLQLEGVTPHDQIKHLVVDEMQDYTPAQYRVLARLFPCKNRHMLYVACTRAMHRLHLTHVGPRTPLLETAVN
jgi:DNA helicase II / ATP-dependent DNA helicase PcrA